MPVINGTMPTKTRLCHSLWIRIVRATPINIKKTPPNLGFFHDRIVIAIIDKAKRKCIRLSINEKPSLNPSSVKLKKNRDNRIESILGVQLSALFINYSFLCYLF